MGERLHLLFLVQPSVSGDLDGQLNSRYQDRIAKVSWYPIAHTHYNSYRQLTLPNLVQPKYSQFQPDDRYFRLARRWMAALESWIVGEGDDLRHCGCF